MTHDSVVAEDRAITAFMQRLADEPISGAPPLPDVRILWLKAQLIRQWDAQRKAAMPVDLLAPFEIAAGVAAAMLLLFWSVPSVFEWIPGVIF